MADLPAPLIPTSATSGPREAPAVLETPPAASPSAAASSSDAVVPSAFATWARRAMEMLPAPDSSSARNRSETPQRSESARREKPRCSRAARTEAPMLARRASLERVAVVGRAVTWPCTILHGNGVRNRALGTILLCESAAPGVPSAAMEAKAAPPTSKTQFETHPDRYRHWTLVVEGDMARLTMEVEPFAGQDDKIQLKSNSYDLSVDIELADAVQRLRFTHPEVKAVVVTSGHDRIFCAGANIYMLASSTHPFKVNFCKYTNETRLAIEEASAQSGQRYLAACNGATAGGGYELALACDQIVLVDDGSSTVSLPEVPLLAVLPGTGRLTRVVDKREVRRELADALLRLRFEHEQIGMVLLHTEGDREKAYAAGELMSGPEWILRETRLLWGRVLRRLDVTARSFFAVVDEKSCFAGPLFELLVAADRSYVLDAEGVAVRPGSLCSVVLPMWNGL